MTGFGDSYFGTSAFGGGAYVTLDDVFLVEIGRPGLPGTGVTEAEKAQILSDLIALQDRAEIAALTDIPDVDTTGVADGMVLVWDSTLNAGAGGWKVSAVGGTLTQVDNNTVESVVADVMKLSFRNGLVTTPNPVEPKKVQIALAYGGSGTSDAVARSDHSHSATLQPKYTFGATGSLSSGTRTLVNDTITGLDPAIAYDLSARLSCDFKNTINAGNARFAVQIGAATADTVTRRGVGGVDRPAYVETTATATGVSTLSILATVQYIDGDPSDILGGAVYVTARPRR